MNEDSYFSNWKDINEVVVVFVLRNMNFNIWQCFYSNKFTVFKNNKKLSKKVLNNLEEEELE